MAKPPMALITILIAVAAAVAGIATGVVISGKPSLTVTTAGDTASALTTLTANTSLLSGNGDYQLLMTPGGDLVENSLHDISPIVIGYYDDGYQGGGNSSALDGNDTVSGTMVGTDVVQLWHSGTSGNPGARAVVQGDGNFVIYSATGAVLWSTGTADHPGARLIVQSDANVVLYDGSQALWSTNRVSVINEHGDGQVKLRNCLGNPDLCNVAQTLPGGTGVTMLCWESHVLAGMSPQPPTNKWFYVMVNGAQDNLGYVNAYYVDNQITTPQCVPELRLGQSPPPVPSSPQVTPPASSQSTSETSPPSPVGQPTPSSSPTGTTPAPPQQPVTYTETVGGPTHTWTNYLNAGGTEGPTIPTGQSVQISCVVQGFKVADGNTNWYRIASSPWNGVYYASADAFYNNGATSGSLQGTPYVDPAVPPC